MAIVFVAQFSIAGLVSLTLLCLCVGAEAVCMGAVI